MKCHTYLNTKALLIGILFLIVMAPVQSMAAHEIRQSMVKIFTTEATPDYRNPWRLKAPQQTSGSGCIIDNKLILTNAHVINNHKFIQVRLLGQAEKYKASVVAVSHETDLALLSVDDATFFNNVRPLPLGVLPELQDEVYVYGFPKGGDTMSITKGVVSRVEHVLYAHSFLKFLAVQIDAAVNSGNSGGPVIADGKIVGLATQILLDADNTNHAVPVSLIKQFLTDLEDDRHDGVPQIGIGLQKLENDALRQKYGLQPDQTGVLVNMIAYGSAAEGSIQEQDILLKIDGHAIANDGSVEFRENERTNADYYVEQHQVDDEIHIELLREGVIKQIRFKLARDKSYQVPRGQNNTSPSFYIFGGLVFSPLTINYLRVWGDSWYEDAPTDLLYSGMIGHVNKNKQEVVNLIKVLPDDVNVGYHNMSDEIIEQVDGIPVRDFDHFVSLIEGGANSLVEFKLINKRIIVIDRKQALKSQDNIRRQYGISNVLIGE